MWNIGSVLMLWLLFESTVPLLEVLPEENFLLIALLTMSVSCFYAVKRLAPENFVSAPYRNESDVDEAPDEDDDEGYTRLQIDNDEEDDDENHTDDETRSLHAANPAVCKLCHKYTPPRAFHCARCRTCIARHDHHNVWLDCCIGESNHRLYFAGTSFGVAAAAVGWNLAVTAVCHPMLVGTVWGVHVFVPDDCQDIYVAAWE